MMKIFTMNSVYEVDEANTRIRRLRGDRAPTPRQGEDGQWKDYADLFPTGDGYYIVWSWEEWGARGTLTSPVKRIEREGEVA